MGRRCLLVILVSGNRRLPVPPANTTPFIELDVLNGRDTPACTTHLSISGLTGSYLQGSGSPRAQRSVSRAINSSSLVGITHTGMRELSLEMRDSIPIAPSFLAPSKSTPSPERPSQIRD